MKIKLSKQQWEMIGRKTGWIKQAQQDQQAQEDQETKKQIPLTILEQLGGNKFATMTGAKNFSSVENSQGLSFKIPGAGFAKNGINYVKIILNPQDTYNMEFGRTRGTTYKIINTLNDVHNDQLQEIFTQETGLNTHL